MARPGDELLWTVREHPVFRALAAVHWSPFGGSLLAFPRSRVVARAHRPIWDRINGDPGAVIHIGLNCSALKPPDAPLVYECMDSTLNQLGSRHYVRAAGRRCIIHCQTERIRLALESTMAHRKPKWTTVTSPCYFATYPAKAEAHGARDPMLVAFVGRLTPEKNPLLFVDAIARVREGGVPCRALILGEGPLLPAVRTRIDQHGLRAVTQVEFDLNPADRLMEAAVYVNLQSSDNYGSQALLEAMGAGCAIVASDVGETSRLVNDDVGVLVGLDKEQLAAAISSLLGEPTRTARMGEAASKLVRTQYTADRYADFLESLYSLALERVTSMSTDEVGLTT